MVKVSGVEMAQFLRKLAADYRKLASENDEYKMREKVKQLQEKMASKGINPYATESELRDSLIKKARDGRLDVVEEAVELSGYISSEKLASLDTGENAKSSDVSGAELTSFVLSGSE